METYAEVLLRNEPKNYTVRWELSDGKTESSAGFENFEKADMFADVLRSKDFLQNVRVLRSGRHPSAKVWAPTRREKTIAPKRDIEYGITVDEAAWQVPAGYVDGDADKHGPVVTPKLDGRVEARSISQKVEWAKNNSFTNRMIGI